MTRTSVHGSIRFRVTALAAVLAAVILGATAVALIALQRQQLLSNLDNPLEQRADTYETTLGRDPDSTALSRTNDEDRAIQLVAPDGTVLLDTPNISGHPPLRADIGTRVQVISDATLPRLEDDVYRILSRRVDGPNGPVLLHVAQNSDDLNDVMRGLTLALAVAVPAVVALLAGLTWWLVGRTLRPVDLIRAEVAEISGAHLDRRVHVFHHDDEITRLATTMNHMLDRLDSAARRQRRFVADASHELRTPLTRIRTEVEVDLNQPDNADPRATSETVLEEAIGLQHLLDDLLFLARSDESRTLLRTEPVDLDEVVRLRRPKGEGPVSPLSSRSRPRAHGRQTHRAGWRRRVGSGAASTWPVSVTVRPPSRTADCCPSSNGIPDAREFVTRTIGRVRCAPVRESGSAGEALMADVTIEEFRAEARAFLDANAKPKPDVQDFVWGEGSDDAALFEEVDREKEQVELAAAQEWRAKRYDAGLGWITGPEDMGGRALPRTYESAYNDLEAAYDVPDQGFFGIGLGMVAPTILDHGKPEVSRDLLPKMYRGDVVGCQLFSEPGAGSDLASLQMKAEKDGDEWIVTGQKVWTSGAHYSDVGEVICRTDPDMPKHKGLTGFVVDMKSDGIDIRPLRQMTGGANFNEVFFNEVRIPDVNRLGDVNDGWRVALTTLMNERASIGGGGGGGGFTRVREMVRHFGVEDDPIVRQKLMDIYINGQILKYTNQRAIAKMKAGQLPGPEMSGGKLSLTENMRRTVDLVSSVLGPRLAADTGEWGTFSWAGYVLGMPAMAIAGGSDQVLRNIMGERVLGLPKEPGIDTTSPFKDLAVGTRRKED